MNIICLKAYAKINIGLNIISQRRDGYHNIETIFQQIDLFDQLKLSGRDDPAIIVRTDHSQLPTNEDNICHQAVKLIQKATGFKEGVVIEIKKRIPIGAGLGGGSSDAAAVLRGLNQLWQLQLTKKDLLNIALKLGADVPFFLNGGTALAFGIGEKLKPITAPFNFYCVLIYPNIEISSTWAYKNFNFSLTKTKKSIKLAHIFSQRIDISDLKNLISNDLEEVVFQRYQELRDIKQLLYLRGAFFASMSGSGSTIYGLFKDYTDAVVVMRSIPKPYQLILAKPMITKNHL